MEDGFNVYLTSNVAPDTFPRNNPSQFSTLLANEVQLDGDGWEVGVCNIMYPSNVKSVTEDEDKLFVYKHRDKYRDILPIPARISDAKRIAAAKNFKRVTSTKELEHQHENEVSNYAVNFELKFPKGSKTITKDILQAFNDTTWKKKRIFELDYNAKSKKFILHCYKEDILLTMPSVVSDYLGFQDSTFVKGSYWAWSAFDSKKKLAEETYKFSLFDLQVLIKEKRLMARSYVGSQGNFSFQTTVVNKFANEMDEDLFYDPKFTITVKPQEGKISFHTIQDYPKKLSPFEQRVFAFSFDENTRKVLKLKPIYVKPKDQDDFTITTATYRQLVETLRGIDITIYFVGLRELEMGHEKTPVATISIDSEIPFTQPSDFLPKLNIQSTKYNYSFIFDKTLQRFTLKTGDKYFIQLTRSLAIILGFEDDYKKFMTFLPSTETAAAHFPVLNRAITTLYIYSNIVDTVFVGDVKAPLLLTCPFKKDVKNAVSQLEFLRPIYTKLNRNQLQQIDIEIHDEAGSLIPFLYGKTVLTLHFRRRSNFM